MTACCHFCIIAKLLEKFIIRMAGVDAILLRKEAIMQRESLHCGELIKRLNDILGRCANEKLREDDMTSSQVKMLMTINETKDECITLKELEKHFGVAQATIAGTAARLEKKGMIESFYDPSDKRVKHVRITDKGRAMCVHAGKAMLEKEKWFLSALSADEKEELHRLLQKVYDDVNNCERKCKKC